MVTTPASANLVRLSVGSLTVGFDMTRVLGVERADRIRPSDAPECVGKIVNRAGEWPVVNLATRLGLDHQPSSRTGQVLLTAIGGSHRGLLVDRVSQVTRLEAGDLKPIPKSLAKRDLYFDAVWLDDQAPIFILSPDRLEHGVDLFAPDLNEETEPPRPKSSTRKVATDRLLAFGLREYPLPGGRLTGFGIPLGSVVEIIDLPIGTMVPGAAAHVREVVHWRDHALPIVDLSSWCGLASSPSTGDVRRAIIIRAHSGEKVGLLTGSGVRMYSLPLPHVPVRRTITVKHEHVLGVFDTNDVTLILPNLAKLTGR
jgi:chemotaxis signal transduction protein